MRTFIAASLALLIAFPASAATARKTKTRTLSQTIKFVESNARDVDMNPRVASTLGYSGPVHTLTLSFKADVTPDHRDHIFAIVYDQVDERKIPTALVWFVSRITDKDSVKLLDGYVMRLEPNGKLLSMAHGEGVTGKVTQSQLDLASAETKKVLDGENDFYTRKAIGLAFTK